MTVLNEEEIKELKKHYLLHVDIINLIDTIADRDRQIRELGEKVEALELKLHRPFPMAGEPILCGAVKEPEVKCDYCNDGGCTECPEDSGNKQYF